MLRTALAALAIAVAAWLLIDLLVTSDREEVEQEVGRLLDAARRGGDNAVEEILAALAQDYRGEGLLSRDAVERRLRHWIGGDRRIDSLESGDYRAIWKGDEILVPILSLRVTAGGTSQQALLSVSFAERGGRWLIVGVNRVQWGR